jgi:hypothetical protein
MPFPAAVLVVRGRFFGRGALADARGTEQVLDRVARAVARASAYCSSQILDRGAQVVACNADACLNRSYAACAHGKKSWCGPQLALPESDVWCGVWASDGAHCPCAARRAVNGIIF